MTLIQQQQLKPRAEKTPGQSTLANDLAVRFLAGEFLPLTRQELSRRHRLLAFRQARGEIDLLTFRSKPFVLGLSKNEGEGRRLMVRQAHHERLLSRHESR